MESTYHYPPELFQLIVDAVPKLCRSKRDVLTFFRGAGVGHSMLTDIEAQVVSAPDSIRKSEITRTVLTRLNESGDKSIRERREVLKRIIEFEDFSTCWPDDRLPAQGLVSQIQRVVNVKDSFTRMRLERESEVRQRQEAERKKAEELRELREKLAGIRQDFYRLFGMDNPNQRGKLLEEVLNRLFDATGILVREAFTRAQEPGQGVVEQIDGVIELDGDIYLVEMKWLKEPVGVSDVSQHLVRVFSRSASRGIFISYMGYTGPAIAMCKESLNKVVVVLSTLDEFVLLLEREGNMVDFLKAKVRGSIIDKQPLTKVLS